MNESDTPRTDRANMDGYVTDDFARQLELELVQTQTDVKRLKQVLEPFAQAACEVSFRADAISPSEIWLWKPSSTGRSTYGINYQHLLDAAKEFATAPPT